MKSCKLLSVHEHPNTYICQKLSSELLPCLRSSVRQCPYVDQRPEATHCNTPLQAVPVVICYLLSEQKFDFHCLSVWHAGAWVFAPSRPWQFQSHRASRQRPVFLGHSAMKYSEKRHKMTQALQRPQAARKFPTPENSLAWWRCSLTVTRYLGLSEESASHRGERFVEHEDIQWLGAFAWTS